MGLAIINHYSGLEDRKSEIFESKDAHADILFNQEQDRIFRDEESS